MPNKSFEQTCWIPKAVGATIVEFESITTQFPFQSKQTKKQFGSIIERQIKGDILVEAKIIFPVISVFLPISATAHEFSGMKIQSELEKANLL